LGDFDGPQPHALAQAEPLSLWGRTTDDRRRHARRL